MFLQSALKHEPVSALAWQSILFFVRTQTLNISPHILTKKLHFPTFPPCPCSTVPARQQSRSQQSFQPRTEAPRNHLRPVLNRGQVWLGAPRAADFTRQLTQIAVLGWRKSTCPRALLLELSASAFPLLEVTASEHRCLLPLSFSALITYCKCLY